MRILVLLSENWNDSLYPNNNESNWFSAFPNVDVFTISGGAGFPQNNCCKHYFLLNDLAMVKSFLPWRKAGRVLHLDEFPRSKGKSVSLVEKSVYFLREKLHYPWIRLIRELVWRYGRIDTELLREYIEYAHPDIVFSIRMGSVKMCRLEKIVSGITKAPIVAYTGDNEYSQDGISGGLFSQLSTLWTRRWLNRMIPIYKLYYCMSESQMDYYKRKFGVETKFLVKSGDFSVDKIHSKINNPIRLVYAGKLYWGRDQTLMMIHDALREINSDGVAFILDIYTSDSLSPAQRLSLDDGITATVHPAVSASDLLIVYAQSDIAIHAEGLDYDNAQKTKHSFSTKIMDCMSSGCAILAVCNCEQAGLAYLRKNDIAFTATDRNELVRILHRIIEDKGLIEYYANKALKFGLEHHSKEQTQKKLYSDFERVITEMNE